MEEDEELFKLGRIFNNVKEVVMNQLKKKLPMEEDEKLFKLGIINKVKEDAMNKLKSKLPMKEQFY
jgi:hypothetical protein